MERILSAYNHHRSAVQNAQPEFVAYQDAYVCRLALSSVMQVIVRFTDQRIAGQPTAAAELGAASRHFEAN
jgi:hypothetical protein